MNIYIGKRDNESTSDSEYGLRFMPFRKMLRTRKFPIRDHVHLHTFVFHMFSLLRSFQTRRFRTVQKEPQAVLEKRVLDDKLSKHVNYIYEESG